MQNSKPQLVLQQINQIEIQLNTLGLINSHPPSDEAMASAMPFAYDQMLFTEWLQWILIPKTRHLAENDLPLPSNCSIHPLAEEEFKTLPQETDSLLAEIKILDQLFDDKIIVN